MIIQKILAAIASEFSTGTDFEHRLEGHTYPPLFEVRRDEFLCALYRR